MNRGYTKTAQNRSKQSEWVFLSMVEVDLLTGCWIWTGASQGKYGVYYIPGKRTTGAHRHSYEMFVGPIPLGLHLDHLCRNTACVNPSHLEPVTVRENVMRAATARATINANKTHCHRGHNDWYVWGTHRQCRTCKLENQRQQRAVA